MATREDRIFWQALRICPICEKRKLYFGEKNCIECRAKYGEYRRTYNLKHRERINAHNRERNREMYQRRKELGVCVRCGSKNIKPGSFKCYQCLEKDKVKQHEYRERRKERVVNG